MTTAGHAATRNPIANLDNLFNLPKPLISLNFPEFSKKVRKMRIQSRFNGEIRCFDGRRVGLAFGSVIVTTLKGRPQEAEQV